MIHIEEHEKRIENRKDMLGWLLFSPYGRVTMFVMAAVILSFCAPPPASVPTATPANTATAEAPTAIPLTATEAASPTPEKKEYPPTNVTFEGVVTLSMDNFMIGNFMLPGGAELRKWMLVKLSNGQEIAVNNIVEDSREGTMFLTLISQGVHLPPGERWKDGEPDGPNGPWGLYEWNWKLLQVYGLKDRTVRVEFTTGNNSSSFLTGDNPLDKTLTGDLGNTMVEFGQTQDASILPTYPEITVNGQRLPVAIVYYMQVIEDVPSDN